MFNFVVDLFNNIALQFNFVLILLILFIQESIMELSSINFLKLLLKESLSSKEINTSVLNSKFSFDSFDKEYI